MSKSTTDKERPDEQKFKKVVQHFLKTPANPHDADKKGGKREQKQKSGRSSDNTKG